MCHVTYVARGESTFNRTSLESKRARTRGGTGTADQLLIEPVWNRNLGKPFYLVRQVLKLLIEPVWNRNVV